jgi:hypothetical protein
MIKVNGEKLYDLLRKRRITRHTAKQMGISYPCLRQKLKGESEWRLSEVNYIARYHVEIVSIDKDQYRRGVENLKEKIVETISSI